MIDTPSNGQVFAETVSGIAPARAGRPQWLKKKIRLRDCQSLQTVLRRQQVHTVCEQAACPNIGECFQQGTATLMILGTACTRGCRFCAVNYAAVPAAPDPDEPERVAQTIARLGLRHAVITSVTRDDLADGGAAVFAAVVAAVRRTAPAVTVEVLTPDFQGHAADVAAVTASRPDIFAHNVETVPRLYPAVRGGADYRRSLRVLAAARQAGCCLVKSGVMVGLGETTPELAAVFSELRAVGCDFLSIGQYLAPAKAAMPVVEYIRPEQFADYKRQAIACGFRHVECGPYVRSSYLAHRYLAKSV